MFWNMLLMLQSRAKTFKGQETALADLLREKEHSRVEAGYATVLARAMTFSRVWFDRSAHRSMIWDLGFRAKLGLRIYGYSLRS